MREKQEIMLANYKVHTARASGSDFINGDLSSSLLDSFPARNSGVMTS
jgi:hypothetical protein